MTDEVSAWLEGHGGELVAVRRRLHAHPELSGEEHETTRLLCDRLAAEGLAPRVLSSGTGLLCDVGAGGPVLALRADLDALAMDDLKDGDLRSTRPGVAHACGHDVHTAVVLGAGLHLAATWPADGARLRLVFQPAEERVPGGAHDVIADGGLDDVDAIFGLHCEPKLATGTVGLRSGAITSATDAIDVVLTGPGGHTARPELTVDLVDVAARVAHELPRRLRARAGADRPLKVVFGAVHGGDAPNVIPTRVELRGVVRTQSEALWTQLPDLVGAEVDAIVAEAAGGGPAAEVEVSHTPGVPPVVNDGAAIALAERAVVGALGPAAAVPAPQSWGGDDFGWYTRRVPGAYLRLGTLDPAGGAPLDLHAGRFDVDEAAIGVGVRVLVGIARAWLADRAG